MSSIHAEQPEDVRRDVRGRDAVERIRDTVKEAPTCFFRTAVAQGDSDGVRPMNVRQVDDAGNLWFLSAVDSHKNREIGQDPRVEIYLQGTDHSGFLHLQGTATVTRDPAKIRELWDPMIRTWFTEGVDDPRITVLRVTPVAGYYWDNKHGDTVAGLKMMIGAAIGKTLDDSVEGRVSVAAG